MASRSRCHLYQREAFHDARVVARTPTSLVFYVPLDPQDGGLVIMDLTLMQSLPWFTELVADVEQELERRGEVVSIPRTGVSLILGGYDWLRIELG